MPQSTAESTASISPLRARYEDDKWQLQPEWRGASWQLTIRNQRRGIARRLRDTPSLRPRLQDPDWLQGAWDDAVAKAAAETGLAEFPDHCPWSREQLLSEAWLP